MAPQEMLDIQTGTVSDDEYVAAPIPAGQVLDGQPQARSCDLSSSRDGALSMNLWDCTAGRFRWYFANDELIQVLEGEVHVTDEAGEVTVLRAGSTAHFAAGTHMVWEVPEYVRKLAIHHAPSTLAGRAVRKLRIKAARTMGDRRSHHAPAHVTALASGVGPVLNGSVPLL